MTTARRTRVATPERPPCAYCGGPIPETQRNNPRYCSRECYRAGGSVFEEYEPSPEEIAEACAAIRAEWTPKERRKRLRPDGHPVRWKAPVARVHCP